MFNGHVPHKTTARLYTLQTAAEALGGISIWTLRGHIKRGTLSTVRIGKRVLISRETLERIAAQGLPSLKTRKPGRCVVHSLDEDVQPDRRADGTGERASI